MKNQRTELPQFLSEGSKISQEITITGKWSSKNKGGFFKKSSDSKEMLSEWDSIHNEAKKHNGMLSTEINPDIGQEAILVNHVFRNLEAFEDYLSGIAGNHHASLSKVAKSELHMVRGIRVPKSVQDALKLKNVTAAIGEYQFGYVKNDYYRPDPKKAIHVTAKWMCKEGQSIEDLTYWWQIVGTEAFTLEKGLLRFEVYRVVGENALIIHETFEDTNMLQFHLSKGTANKYKKEIDEVAYPEDYFFRGPVSWQIRAYSKFLKLPATYTKQGLNYTQPGGSMSEGKI